MIDNNQSYNIYCTDHGDSLSDMHRLLPSPNLAVGDGNARSFSAEQRAILAISHWKSYQANVLTCKSCNMTKLV